MRPRERAAELKLFRERVARNLLKSAKNGRRNEREEENAAEREEGWDFSGVGESWPIKLKQDILHLR